VFVGEAFGEDLVDDGFRLKVVEEFLFEGFVLGGGFEGEDDGFGGEAVFEGVEFGFGLAFGGAGSGGFLRVAAVGVDLFLGCHGCLHIQGRRRGQGFWVAWREASVGSC
jgi:hypothetical protein